MSTLLLRLAGPMQAWGTASRFNIRQTGTYPSKSGVVGLLAASLGLRRDADLTALRALRFGVRADQAGTLLRDYHMVHYLKGKKEDADETERYYLADAVFLAGLESGDRPFLEELDAALRNPVWPPYLGRRSCPPTLPLALGIRDAGLYDALCQEPWQVPEWRRTQWLRKHPDALPSLPITMDADGTGYGRAVSQDDPISFDQRDRRYGFRAAERHRPVTPPDFVPAAAEPTEHDAFAELEDEPCIYPE